MIIFNIIHTASKNIAAKINVEPFAVEEQLKALFDASVAKGEPILSSIGLENLFWQTHSDQYKEQISEVAKERWAELFLIKEGLPYEQVEKQITSA